MNNRKTNEFYKAFYEKNRVSLLQHKSLRHNFQKMVNDVLGKDYYNMAMDVYDSDRICCEDITQQSKSFFKSLVQDLRSKLKNKFI